MKYYAHIDSKGELTGIGMTKMIKDSHDSENVQNIEVSQEIYENRDMYILIDGRIVIDPEYDKKRAVKFQEELVNDLYEIKAQKAYGGVIINDTYTFETNGTSITNTVASLALMTDGQTANWKFYKDNEPAIVVITKEQLVGIAAFAQKMINDCFAIEGICNENLKKAKVADLINEQWRESFKTECKEEMDKINNKLTVKLG